MKPPFLPFASKTDQLSKKLAATIAEIKDLESILQHVRHPIVVGNPQGQVQWVNNSFQKLSGYQLAEIRGQPLDQIMRGPDTDPATTQLVRAKLAACQPVDVEILSYDRAAKEFWIRLEIEPVLNSEEKLIRFIAVLNDLTESRTKSALLDGSERIYRELFNTTRDAIVSVGENRFFECNAAALELFRFDSKEEFCACTPADVSPEFQPCGQPSSEGVMAHVNKAMQEGACQFDWVHQRKDGSCFDAEVSLSRYQIESGSVLQASVRDISVRKAAEATLIDERKAAVLANQTKSDFLANMSHEIRTPLNALLGYTEVLKQGGQTKTEQEEYLQIMHKSGQHLLGLINDILDLSKVEAGKMDFEVETCSIWDLANEVINAFRIQAQEKGLTLEAIAKTSLPSAIVSDSVRLKQLLTNLTANAIKFTESGSVTIAISVLESDAVLSSSHSSQSNLVIEVQDTGMGISKEHLPHLFVPFNQGDNAITRRFGGTGLGLAISQRIAEGLGGNIQVKSEQGEGSTFRICLPLTSKDSLNKEATFQPAPLQALPSNSSSSDSSQKSSQTTIPQLPSGTRILLCEDGETNRTLMTHLLNRGGCKVTTAENGLEGVEAIEKNPDGFDLVLMDMQMPVMDGYTAAQAIKTRGYTKPIIALTAYAMRGDEERCLASGCSGYLTKPLDINKFFSTVAKALQQSQKGRV